jgi:hypothetical protein
MVLYLSSRYQKLPSRTVHVITSKTPIRIAAVPTSFNAPDILQLIHLNIEHQHLVEFRFTLPRLDSASNSLGAQRGRERSPEDLVPRQDPKAAR